MKDFEFCQFRRDKSLSEGCIAAKTREDTVNVTRQYKFLSGCQVDLCVEEF